VQHDYTFQSFETWKLMTLLPTYIAILLFPSTDINVGFFNKTNVPNLDCWSSNTNPAKLNIGIQF
jgi:hypothetical protein